LSHKASSQMDPCSFFHPIGCASGFW